MASQGSGGTRDIEAQLPNTETSDQPSPRQGSGVLKWWDWPKVGDWPLRTILIGRVAVATAIFSFCAGCAFLLWMVINLSVPSLRRVTVLGSLLWKWSLFAALISLGYHLLLISYESILFAIENLMVMSNIPDRHINNVVYGVLSLTKSVRWVIYLTSILQMWLFFVDTTNAHVHRYGKLTLESILVGAVFNVAMRVLLLRWKNNLILGKYEGKILLAGCQLYFLLLLLEDYDPFFYRPLVAWWDRENYTPEPLHDPTTTQQERKTMPTPREDYYNGLRQATRRKIPPLEEYMKKKGAGLGHIHCVAKHLISNFELTLGEDGDIQNIGQNLRNIFLIDARSEFNIKTILPEKTSMEEKDVELSLELLQKEGRATPTYIDFENLMVDWNKNCYNEGQRIKACFNLMRVLEHIMTGCAVVLAFIIWVYITGLGTAKVVVGLASVFVALSFAFGDTCKTFLLGVLFTFVIHPFDVGDRCIIDNKELTVKKMSILATTFYGSKSSEVHLYLNSNLVNQSIVLLRGEQESKRQDDSTIPIQRT